jgi:hypothetical protein
MACFLVWVVHQQGTENDTQDGRTLLEFFQAADDIFFGAHIYYTYTMFRFLFKKILKRNLVYMEYSLRFGKRSHLG